MPITPDGHPSATQGHSWSYLLDHDSTDCTEAVKLLLAAEPPGLDYGRHIAVLAESLDAQGRTAVQMAKAGPRAVIYSHLLFCGRYEVQAGAPEHRSATSVVLRALDRSDKPDFGVIFDEADVVNKDGILSGAELSKAAKTLGLSRELIVTESHRQSRNDADLANKSVSKLAFVSACKQLIGDGPRQVVIKLMQDHGQWRREMLSRDPQWVEITGTFGHGEKELDSLYVVQALVAPSQKEMAKAVRESQLLKKLAGEYLDGDITRFEYPVVMDAANRNLMQIYQQERPDLNAVRTILTQLFEAVAHLHEMMLMHGDIKLLNVVRFGHDNRLRLIDFDAAARIYGELEDKEPSYAGAKFSSAMLPPEMFYELRTDERKVFDQYWQDADQELREKVTPKRVNQSGKALIVKSFRTDGEGKPVLNGLLYDLVKASPKIDVWSLGVLAFALFTGEPLVPATRDDDCASGAGMRFLCEWKPESEQERLEKISDDLAHDLVSKMLQRGRRPTVKELRDRHPFFHPKSGDAEIKEQLRRIEHEKLAQIRKNLTQIDAKIDVIKELTLANQREIKNTCSVLLTGMYEATEVTTPTVFIVCNEMLPEPPSEEEEKQLLEIAEDGSGVTVSGELISASFTADGVSLAAEGKLKEHIETLNTGMKWMKRIKDIGSKLANCNVSDAFVTINEGIKDLVTGETMYLYLVDELTGDPVRAEGWPIKITKPKEVVSKLVPVMQVGLRAMSIYNGAAGVARMFGYPLPKVPDAWSSGARESVDLLKKESSVEDYNVVQGVLDSKDADKKDKKESESLRGASLRDFVNFLRDNDPGLTQGPGRSGDFAGLRRIGDPKDGTALWTSLSDPAEINAALEKRSLQREAEELRSKEPIVGASEVAATRRSATAAAKADTSHEAEHNSEREERADETARADPANPRVQKELEKSYKLKAQPDNPAAAPSPVVNLTFCNTCNCSLQ